MLVANEKSHSVTYRSTLQHFLLEVAVFNFWKLVICDNKNTSDF